MDHHIFINPDGTFQALYDDDLRDLFDMLGTTTINRAGLVEPDAHGRWTVDMSPLFPLKLDGFRLREDALTKERELANRFFADPDHPPLG